MQICHFIVNIHFHDFLKFSVSFLHINPPLTGPSFLIFFFLKALNGLFLVSVLHFGLLSHAPVHSHFLTVNQTPDLAGLAEPQVGSKSAAFKTVLLEESVRFKQRQSVSTILAKWP